MAAASGAMAQSGSTRVIINDRVHGQQVYTVPHGGAIVISPQNRSASGPVIQEVNPPFGMGDLMNDNDAARQAAHGAREMWEHRQRK